MKKKIYLLTLITVILLLPQASYSQTNLLTNGDFETGNFSGWTVTSTQTGHYCTPWSVRTIFTCNGPNATPQNGSFLAGNGFDGTGGTMRLYQDVTLPELSSIPLTFTYMVNWNIPNGSNQSRIFRVDIHDTSDNLLETVFSYTALSGRSNQSSGWQTETVYLNTYHGQPVRISFTNIIPQAYTGPAQFAIDNIVLNAFPSTSSAVEIGGNVQNSDGYGIGNATVSFTDTNGILRTTRTNQFGYFRFDNVVAGNSYVLEVQHRQYEFENNPRVILVENARKDIIFSGSPTFFLNEKTDKSKSLLE